MNSPLKSYNVSLQLGLTLIELMIAMVLGLIVIAGMIQIFATTKNSFRLQESLNVAQENARFAMHFLEYDARMTDHWGGVEAGQVNNIVDVKNIGTYANCQGTWLFDLAHPMEGYDGYGVIPANKGKPISSDVSKVLGGCVRTENYEPGTDLIVFRYAEAAANAPEKIPSGAAYLRVSPGLNALLKLADGEDKTPFPMTLPSTIKPAYYPVATHAYYVKRCNRPHPEVCPPEPQSGHTKTLVRIYYDGKRISEEPLIEGVTDLQITYLVDTDQDGYADGCSALTASQVHAGATPSNKSTCLFTGPSAPTIKTIGWNDVVGLNITVTVEPQRCLAWNNQGCASSKSQKEFTKAVQVRNRSRS